MTPIQFFFLFICGSTYSLETGIYQGISTATQDILQRINDLERRDAQQQAEIDAVLKENIELRKSNLNLAYKIDLLEKQNSQLEDRIKHLEDRDGDEIVEHAKAAFRATDSLEETNNGTKRDREIMTKQNISRENGHIEVRERDKKGAHFQITINGQRITTMYAHSTDVYETISQTVIFSLSTGDKVAIRSADVDTFVHRYDHSMFSGFLLASTEEGAIVG